MTVYNYKARDSKGSAVKGAMEAPSVDELSLKLHKMGYMPVQIKAVNKFPDLEFSFIPNRISTEDKIMFYLQLSNLINSGISIMSALNILSKQIENRRLRSAILSVARSIESGESFSAALSGHPRIFSRLMISMARAGEASGKLGAILARFAEYTEKQAELSQKIKGALFYPALLLCAGVAVIMLIVTFLIPQFTQIFLKAGIKLPLATLILYNFGMFIKNYWLSVIFILVFIYFVVKYSIDTAVGALAWDTLKLKLPVVGVLYLRALVVRFARTFSTLAASGVPILESLNILRDVIGNKRMAQVIDNARFSVERGERISDSFRLASDFPGDAVHMIAVGEETGDIDGMLKKIADIYEMYLGYSIKKLTVIIEPLFLVIMGGMVGLIMLSMLLPIFDMIKILRH